MCCAGVDAACYIKAELREDRASQQGTGHMHEPRPGEQYPSQNLRQSSSEPQCPLNDGFGLQQLLPSVSATIHPVSSNTNTKPPSITLYIFIHASNKTMCVYIYISIYIQIALPEESDRKMNNTTVSFLHPSPAISLISLISFPHFNFYDSIPPFILFSFPLDVFLNTFAYFSTIVLELTATLFLILLHFGYE